MSGTAQYWKTSTDSSAKYYTEIDTYGSFYVGNYPDIFIVDGSGVKIIPDVRFPNEIDKMCDNFNCITVRVIRPDFDNGLTDEQKNHPSEIALKDYPMEYELINDGDLKKLLETTRTFLKNIG